MVISKNRHEKNVFSPRLFPQMNLCTAPVENYLFLDTENLCLLYVNIILSHEESEKKLLMSNFILFFHSTQCGDSPCDHVDMPKEKVTRVSNFNIFLS